MNDATPAETQSAGAPSRASGSSFYTAMRILPRAQREAMFEIYSFCRLVDDVADSTEPHIERRLGLAEWRRHIEQLFSGRPTVELRALAQAVRDFSLRKEDFLAVIDGMDMDAAEDIRAPDWATLDLYCDRVASAVGRLSVRVFGMDEQEGLALAHHLGRALQLTNILRDIDEEPGRHRRDRAGRGSDERGARSGLRCCRHPRARPLPGGRRDHGAQSAPQRESAEDHGGGLSRHASGHDGARLAGPAHARQR